jgi:predicted CoA-substrate-specific enzyme activase
MSLEKARRKISDIGGIVATGYGRVNAKFADRVITEITCHAYAAKWAKCEVQSVIDIGGQDSKAINVNDDGDVEDFVMNDKCAAGTGRFIELIALCLDTPLDDVGKLSLNCKSPATISSMCAVFAESEVVSLVADGVPKPNIFSGIHHAIARRVVAMADRIGVRQRAVGISGGVANNRGMVQALETALGKKLIVPKDPQYIGALGAALLGMRELEETGPWRS